MNGKVGFMKLLLVALLVTAPVFAQEAKIMILEKSDTQDLKQAYKEYREAQKKWEELKNKIAKKYTEEDGKVMEGWDKVQFSRDFRAMVPATYNVIGNGYLSLSGNITSNTGTTTTCADGCKWPASASTRTTDVIGEVDQNLTTKEKPAGQLQIDGPATLGGISDWTVKNKK